jgi:hypothetical protein
MQFLNIFITLSSCWLAQSRIIMGISSSFRNLSVPLEDLSL